MLGRKEGGLFGDVSLPLTSKYNWPQGAWDQGCFSQLSPAGARGGDQRRVGAGLTEYRGLACRQSPGHPFPYPNVGSREGGPLSSISFVLVRMLGWAGLWGSLGALWIFRITCPECFPGKSRGKMPQGRKDPRDL